MSSKLSLFSNFVGGVVVGQFLFERCFRVTRVEGPSMEPLLQRDDRIFGVSPAVFSFCYSVYHSLPSFGGKSDDAASSWIPETTLSRCWNDRVVVCEMSPGTLYCKLTRVPAHRESLSSLYLRGINAPESRDSREFGELPLSSVTSVVVCKIWPTFVPFLGRNFEIRE